MSPIPVTLRHAADADRRAALSAGRRGLHRTLLLAAALICALALSLAAPPAQAEYGDVVINSFSDKAGMRPVVFPHWFHRVRYRCKVCHGDLGFQFKAGGNEINMLKIIDGQFCGACHNGEVAWNVENCNLCHSGKPGLPTHVHESTINALVGSAASPAAPPAKPGSPAGAAASSTPQPK